METLREILEDWPGRLMLGLIVLMLALIPATIYGSIQEQKAWNAFATKHECKVVGHLSASTSTGIGIGVSPSGNAIPVVTTSTTPAKIGYACNDGLTYWR